jgi:hypothetical protein
MFRKSVANTSRRNVAPSVINKSAPMWLPG